MKTIKRLQEELVNKEETIQRLLEEKKIIEMKFNQLECQNNMVMDNLKLVNIEKEQSDKINESLQLMMSAQKRISMQPNHNCSAMISPQNKKVLEEDGI